MINKKITIKDIAKASGVSSYTVSKILSGNPEASKETQKRVLNVVKKLKYIPDPLAQGMRKKSLQSITIILPYEKGRFSTLYFDQLLRGVNDAALKCGYYLLIIIESKKTQPELNYFYGKFENNPLLNNLIVIAPNKLEVKNLRPLYKFKKIILINARDKEIPYVTINNFKAMYEMTSYLIKKGHRVLGYLDAKHFSFDSTERLNAYKQALLDHNIPVNKSLITSSNYNLKDIEAAADFLLENKKLSVIITFSDLLAIYLLKVLFNKGIKVPDDIAVTGFDNIKFSEIMIPALTTTEQPLYKMGKKAFELVVSEGTAQSVEFNARLLPRESA